MSEIVGLGYLGVEARDLDAWETFATQLLGLELAARREDGALLFRLDDYAYRLVVEPGAGDDVAYIGWEVATEAGLQSLAERLRHHQVDVAVGDDALVRRRNVRSLIAFSDPDGIRHEAFVGPLLQPQKPFVSPRSIGNFVTGDQGLGHVVLVTAEIERAQRFFCDIVGFRVSDYIDVAQPPRSFVFMHCSGRHHSLALARVPSPKKLAHLMLETSSIDDVGLTYDLAQRLEYPIAATLGRHTNDRMFSFYVKTPSMWEIEFGADPLTIDDATWHVRRFERTSVWGHVRALPAPPTANGSGERAQPQPAAAR
jgi:biphenyl-2,3-diol 1,2-dioxygenase/3,4-dihydroxy-9,10-secoandrosta-1,3,5(10)-triene-9,17-dione 4,5-dioxygenase